METVFIINKKYIEKNEILTKISDIAKKINAFFSNDENDLTLTKDNMGSFEQIEFGGLNKEYFYETIRNENFIKNYGCLLTIDFSTEKSLIITFLKAFFKEFPNVLLFNEFGEALNNPYIYSKKHLDNFSGENGYDLISTPPQD